MFGPRSERSQRLRDQLELQLAELAAAAEKNDAGTAGIQVQSLMRRKATRRDFPKHLPRRRVVIATPFWRKGLSGWPQSSAGSL
jgi:transposase